MGKAVLRIGTKKVLVSHQIFLDLETQHTPVPGGTKQIPDTKEARDWGEYKAHGPLEKIAATWAHFAKSCHFARDVGNVHVY